MACEARSNRLARSTQTRQIPGMRASARAEMTADDAGAHIAHRIYQRVERMPARKRMVAATDLSNRPKPRATLCRRAMSWCLPWSIFSYPGHLRGIRAILGHEVPNSTAHWWKDRDRLPVWAAERLLWYIGARCAVGLTLCNELRAYIAAREAEPPSKTGAHLKGWGGRKRPRPELPE